MSAVNINYINFDCSWRAEKMKYFMMLKDHPVNIGIENTCCEQLSVSDAAVVENMHKFLLCVYIGINKI